jgi:EAL domain-containing protein (putative c-di-GMP-specific phosphodiesterase class I)
MSDIATSLEIITRLRLKGFGLSIDDFGTGYSSMEKLKQLPFTELKVDRTFVCGATSDDVARAILESSVQMGHALGMNVVAEGAETQEDWDLLAAIDCDEVQGYIAARPMAAEEFIAWKTRWDAGTR